MKYSGKKMFTITGGLCIALAVVGCVSTAPSADFIITPPEQQRVDANDMTIVKLEQDNKVAMIDAKKQRLAQLIASKLDAKKRENTSAAESKHYEFEVMITRYEKGNAFARFMMVGLGQIHIDAHVSVFTLPTRERYAEFDIDKTFAWGGILGASTKIEDLEPAFAEGIANAVVESQQ